MAVSSTAPRRLTAAERRRESVRLRREGKTLDDIAQKLGCSRAAVIKHIRKALADLAETTEAETAEFRAIELERLDALHRSLWDTALGGDLAAVDRVLKLMERRAKLLALDAPAKVASTTPDGEESARACVVLPPTEASTEDWMAKYNPGALE